jgi:hypothetical protein
VECGAAVKYYRLNGHSRREDSRQDRQEAKDAKRKKENILAGEWASRNLRNVLETTKTAGTILFLAVLASWRSWRDLRFESLDKYLWE